MASKENSALFTGKNAVQQSAHIRSVSYPNGNQGFSKNNLGGDTMPGAPGGAPLTNKSPQEVTSKVVYRDGSNPFNNYEKNEAGVLGAKVQAQAAPRYEDSPVPKNASLPDKNQMADAATATGITPGTLSGFPSGGVLGKT